MEFYLTYHDDVDHGGRHSSGSAAAMAQVPLQRVATPEQLYFDDEPPPQSLRPPICKRVSWQAGTQRFLSCDAEFSKFTGVPLAYMQQTTWSEFSFQMSTWLQASSRARALIETSVTKLREATRRAIAGSFNKDTYVFPVGNNELRFVEVLIMALHDEIVWLIFDTGLQPRSERLQRVGSAPQLKNFSFTSLNESLAAPREKKPRRKRRPWDGAMTQFSLSGSDRGSTSVASGEKSSSSSSGSSGSSSRRPSEAPSRPDTEGSSSNAPSSSSSGSSSTNLHNPQLPPTVSSHFSPAGSISHTTLEEVAAAVIAQSAAAASVDVAAEQPSAPIAPAELPSKPNVLSSSSSVSQLLPNVDSGELNNQQRAQTQSTGDVTTTRRPGAIDTGSPESSSNSDDNRHRTETN